MNYYQFSNLLSNFRNIILGYILSPIYDLIMFLFRNSLSCDSHALSTKYNCYYENYYDSDRDFDFLNRKGNKTVNSKVCYNFMEFTRSNGELSNYINKNTFTEARYHKLNESK